MNKLEIPDIKPYMQKIIKKKAIDNQDVVIEKIMREYASACMRSLLDDSSIRIDQFEDYLELRNKILNFEVS